VSLPPLDIPVLLHRYQLRPDKKLGQNFLADEGWLRKVVDTAGLQPATAGLQPVTAGLKPATAGQKPGKAVLEVGPGLGSLTRILATQASQVLAVELDGRLIQPLEDILSPFSNVELIHGDILALDPVALVQRWDANSEYVVVANIPYYITSALIRHLLEAPIRPSRMVLTVQKEVAERIVAVPNDMNLLALSVQVYGSPRIAGIVPANAFIPSPKVDSAIVRIDIDPVLRFSPLMLDRFFRLAKAGFSQKRKTLRNSLSGGLGCSPAQAADLLASAGIDPNRRAETLSLDEWETLATQAESAN
jgi:16S rRNA (adenine1518-N6/adenine1519-N6)-dimethyltransferase